jgi:hypothetical protein
MKMTIEHIIPRTEAMLVMPLVGSTMLELGNKRNRHGTYKSVFTELGLAHTSVDLNGLDGALQLDLQQPLNLGRFDMVTNFGTSEHVAKQEPCWRNIIEATAQVLVCVTPAPGAWKNHGKWYPKPEFYAELAVLNGFRLARLYTDGDGDSKRLLVCARLERTSDVPFVMPSMNLIVDQGDYGVGKAE